MAFIPSRPLKVVKSSDTCTCVKNHVTSNNSIVTMPNLADELAYWPNAGSKNGLGAEVLDYSL